MRSVLIVLAMSTTYVYPAVAEYVGYADKEDCRVKLVVLHFT
jgi:hypothetical protein